jgi:hypothetical protein
MTFPSDFSVEAELLIHTTRNDSKLRQISTRIESTADADVPEAQHLLGVCYLHGWRPFPSDHGVAYEWLKKALNGGCFRAEEELKKLSGMLLSR